MPEDSWRHKELGCSK